MKKHTNANTLAGREEVKHCNGVDRDWRAHLYCGIKCSATVRRHANWLTLTWIVKLVIEHREHAAYSRLDELRELNVFERKKLRRIRNVVISMQLNCSKNSFTNKMAKHYIIYSFQCLLITSFTLVIYWFFFHKLSHTMDCSKTKRFILHLFI